MKRVQKELSRSKVMVIYKLKTGLFTSSYANFGSIDLVNWNHVHLCCCARLSVVCLFRLCALLSDWNVRQCSYAIWLVPKPSFDHQGKFYGDRPRETPPAGRGLNARRVAKYSQKSKQSLACWMLSNILFW